MDFNFNNERPIYVQLIDKIREAIVCQFYPSGSRIPSVREFSRLAQVNPNTVQKALSELEKESLIITDRTNGKFVTNDKRNIEKTKEYLAKCKVKSYIYDMQKIGISLEESINYLQEYGGKL